MEYGRENEPRATAAPAQGRRRNDEVMKKRKRRGLMQINRDKSEKDRKSSKQLSFSFIEAVQVL